MLIRRPSAVTTFYTIEGLGALIFGIAYTLNIYYQTTVVGLTPFQLVIVGTLFEITMFCCEVPTGIVADVYSRRLSVIIGYALIGLSLIVEGLIPLFAAILLIQLVRGLGYTFVSGALQAWIVDEVNDDAALTPLFLRGAQIAQIMGVVGVIVGVTIALIGGMGTAIALSGAIMLGLAAWLAFTMPETAFRPTPPEQRQTFRQMTATFRAGLAVIRGRRVLVLAVGLVIFGGLYSEALDRLWPRQLVDNTQLTTLVIPDVILIGGIGIGQLLAGLLLTEYVKRRVQDKQPGRALRAMFWLAAGQFAAMLGFALIGEFWIAAALLLAISATRSVFGRLFSAWINPHLESSTRATALSMLSQVDAFGEIAGGPAVGAIGGAFGVRAALLVSAGLFAPILPLVIRARRSERAAPAGDG